MHALARVRAHARTRARTRWASERGPRNGRRLRGAPLPGGGRRLAADEAHADRVGGIEQHATHAANTHLSRCAYARDAILGLVVNATVAVPTAAKAHQPYVAVLAPQAAPGVSDDVGLLIVADGQDCMVDHGVGGTRVVDPRVVWPPLRRVHAHDDRAVGRQGVEERLGPIPRQVHEVADDRAASRAELASDRRLRRLAGAPLDRDAVQPGVLEGELGSGAVAAAGPATSLGVRHAPDEVVR
mmetsp:Transcript_137132/g.426136  ORF Transcript_137132/g.426136 Transcript_137132/m.426136 type:complete len:242 (+) Transcript_137132:31-756(+)